MATLFCSNAKLSCEPEVLGAIKDQGVNLAVWERNGPGGEGILIANGAGDAQRLAKGLEPYEFRQLGVGHVGIFKGKLATDEPAFTDRRRSRDQGKHGFYWSLIPLNAPHLVYRRVSTNLFPVALREYAAFSPQA